MMRISHAIALFLIAPAIGCGHSSSTPQPLAPSPVALPAPPSYQVHGYVADTAFRPIADAAVSLVDGPHAGPSTTSDTHGEFWLAATAANPTIRVAKEGYSTAMVTASSNSQGNPQFAYLQLDALAAPVDLVGDYTLTFVADSACSDLPAELRTRTYTASIATAASQLRSGTSLTLTAAGPTFVGKHDGFPIGVAGDNVAFLVYYRQEDFGLVEQTAPNTFVAIQGLARLSVDVAPVTTMTVPLDGIIDYCAVAEGSAWNYDCNSGARVAYARCESSHHQLTLTRRWDE